MIGGGVIVARNLWDDPAFQNEPFSEREAWIWMICEASWKPRQKRVGRVIVSLDRGQLATSIRFMAEAFLWHRNKADRFLKRLQKCNLIRAQSGTGVNVITICKYNEYQFSPKSFGTEAGQQRDSSGTNENKGNKGNKDNPQTPKGDFDEFWSACPRKIGKGAAQKAYAKAVKAVDPQIISDAMATFAKSQAGKDPQYIPHPSTWLNAGRWDDDVDSVQAKRSFADPQDGDILKAPDGRWKEYVSGVGWCALDPDRLKDEGLKND